MSFWAYMLRCSDGRYYVGHTEDLDMRFAQHERGEIEGFTRDRRPVTLVWSEAFPTRDEAFAAERQIKGWSRPKKEALIEGDWERIRALASRAQIAGDVLRDAVSTGSTAPQDERNEGSSIPQAAHPEEGLSLAKARLEGFDRKRSFETPFRQAQRLLRMSGMATRGAHRCDA